MDDDVFRELPSSPGYAVSNKGLVVNLRSERLLSPTVTERGYMQVTISERGGRRTTRYVHQLVAEAFLGDWRPGVRVAHHDNHRGNNVVSNLYVMGAEASPHTYYASPRRNAKAVRIRETQEIFRTAEDCAERIRGHATNIYAVLRGDRKSHRGYTFEYVDLRAAQARPDST